MKRDYLIARLIIDYATHDGIVFKFLDPPTKHTHLYIGGERQVVDHWRPMIKAHQTTIRQLLLNESNLPLAI